MKVLLANATCGAVGAPARGYVNNQITHWLDNGFQRAVLIASILVSFAMRALAELKASVWSPVQELGTLLFVGKLGAVTTISIFCLQVVLPYEHGQIYLAAGHVASSVVVAAGGLFVGPARTRAVAA